MLFFKMDYKVCLFLCLPMFPTKFVFFLHILTKSDFSFVVTASRILELNHEKKLLAEETLYLLMPLPYDGIYIYVFVFIYLIVDYVHGYFYTIPCRD